MEGSPAAAPHGGNRIAIAARLGCRPEELLEASASLVPFGPPPRVVRELRRRLGATSPVLRDYPDRSYADLRQAIGAHHGVDPQAVLPGNGAAELFTWAARDAAAVGLSLLPTPGFADYRRALSCWQAPWRPLPLPLQWDSAFPQPFPAGPDAGPDADGAAPERRVFWITNPHNPSGQLWSRASLEPLLERCGLLIVDEAFLPLVPDGERESLVPLLPRHRHLVVIRSLTKLFAIAGLRLGYALADPERLARWSAWRDPWPVNGPAAAAGQALLADAVGLRRWLGRVQGWVGREGPWLAEQLALCPGLRPLPSAANFLLVRGEQQGCPRTLEPLRRQLEERHRILLRDCRSFEGLGETWLRIALLDRSGNRRLLRALTAEVAGPGGWPDH